MDELIDVFGNTADACFVLDGQQRIVLWNAAAEELLGYSAHQVMGRPCFRVLGGRDERDRAVCRRHCTQWRQGRKGGLVPGCRVLVRTGGGHHRTADMITVVVPTARPGTCYLVHYLLPVEQALDPVQPLPEIHLEGDGEIPLTPITRREYQVLLLLAQGADTDQVAAQLVISRATVRNHIERLLQKLDAHCRLEAVVSANRHRLVPPA